MDAKRRRALLATAIVLAIVLCLVLHRMRRDLQGFWEADPEYAKKAGIGSMFLTVSPGRRGVFSTSYGGYLLITDEDGEILVNNSSLKITEGTFSRSVSVRGGGKFIPADAVISTGTGARAGSMVISSRASGSALAKAARKKVHAVLWRDSRASAAAANEFEKARARAE